MPILGHLTSSFPQPLPFNPCAYICVQLSSWRTLARSTLSCPEILSVVKNPSFTKKLPLRRSPKSAVQSRLWPHLALLTGTVCPSMLRFGTTVPAMAFAMCSSDGGLRSSLWLGNLVSGVLSEAWLLSLHVKEIPRLFPKSVNPNVGLFRAALSDFRVLTNHPGEAVRPAAPWVSGHTQADLGVCAQVPGGSEPPLKLT